MSAYNGRAGSWWINKLRASFVHALCNSFDDVCPVFTVPTRSNTVAAPITLFSRTHFLLSLYFYPSHLPALFKLFLKICSTKCKLRQKVRIRKHVEWIKGVCAWKRSKDETKTVTQKNSGDPIQPEDKRLVVKDEVRRAMFQYDSYVIWRGL